MPLIKLYTSESVPEGKREELLRNLSSIVATAIGKPEQYVMVVLESTSLMLGATAGGAAFADVRSIGGLGGKVNKAISGKVCTVLQESLGLAQDRVYLNFTDVPARDWGWNGSTFG